MIMSREDTEEQDPANNIQAFTEDRLARLLDCTNDTYATLEEDPMLLGLLENFLLILNSVLEEPARLRELRGLEKPYSYGSVNPLFSGTQLLQSLYASRRLASELESSAPILYCAIHVYNFMKQQGCLTEVWDDAEYMMSQMGNEAVFAQKEQLTSMVDMIESYRTLFSSSRQTYLDPSELMVLLMGHLEADGDGFDELRALQRHVLDCINGNRSTRKSASREDLTVAEQLEASKKLITKQVSD